ncbi:hypothetical protein [Ferrimicrobium acidiphilum]|uniref:hypothetical protein n=1 Tax=Ferrimicrobium acidiphilum TaxID=121039 RepID=UPI0023F4F0E9|nr:hypothetical protein [Ferrimicrobium acidiphilum]
MKTLTTPPPHSEASTISDRDSQRVILFSALTGGKISQLEETLAGTFDDHHALLCRQIIAHIDFCDQTITELVKGHLNLHAHGHLSLDARASRLSDAVPNGSQKG